MPQIKSSRLGQPQQETGEQNPPHNAQFKTASTTSVIGSSSSLQKSIADFLDKARRAEQTIRENYFCGRIPPDCCGDGLDEEFVKIFESFKAELSPFESQRPFTFPPNTAYLSNPLFASSAVEAWMWLLNPADMAFGEPGYLDTPEYLAIKNEATQNLTFFFQAPVQQLLTPVQLKILDVLSEKPLTSKEIAKQIDHEEQTVRKYLPELARQNLVRKARRGGYCKLR